jgi:hypothetical protein
MILCAKVPSFYNSRSVKLKYFYILGFYNCSACYGWRINLTSENFTTLHCVAAHAFGTAAVYRI